MVKKKAARNTVDLLCEAASAEYATTIPVGSTRTKLEARVANQKTGSVCIIFCAALPPAGNMYIPEIGFLQAQLASAGFVTIRFNFRGVGQSEGSAYGRSATQEAEDVRDVARWARAHRVHFNLPPLEACWIVGVSYGSVIGSAAASFDEFDGYVAVAYPVNYLWYCTGFDSTKFQDMARTDKPKLYVWGKNDVFGGGKMDSFYESLPSPKRSAVHEELDGTFAHYFRSKKNLDLLKIAVFNFFREQPGGIPSENLVSDENDEEEAATSSSAEMKPSADRIFEERQQALNKSKKGASTKPSSSKRRFGLFK